MKMSIFRELVRELVEEEINNILSEENSEENLDESENDAAVQQAKQMGLSNMGFGRWGKDGKVTHKTQNGRLIQADSAEDERSGWNNVDYERDRNRKTWNRRKASGWGKGAKKNKKTGKGF